MKKLALVLVLALLFGALGTHVSRAQTEIRITWYSDGNEGEVIKEQLAKYMEANPDVKVVLDEVDYANGIQKTLPVQLEAGEGPDIARVTNLGGLAQYYLDLTPYLSDTKYWLDNMDPFLGALRLPGDTTTIPGYMTQLTVTGPFINKTLFDQAGVAVPADGATWEDWAAAAKEVAEKTGTPFAMAMDRSGHRLAGPAVSMGAKYFDADGKPSLVGDEGFKKMAELMVQWHKDGLMPPEVWIGNAGTYAAANEPFVNAQIAFYMSGSWQISQFATNIGDSFDWEAVPNPCGPAACTGMPGGAALVAIKTTKNPEAVAKLMDWLASEEVLTEFYAKTLFLPGHLGIAAKGVDFQTDNPQAKAALATFAAQVGKLDPLAYRLQAYTYNTALFNATRDRLSQVLAGELSLDDAIQRMQDDIDAALAAVK